MSIAEFITDGNYVPGISEYLQSCHDWDDPYVPKPTDAATKNAREKLWAALCQDDRWRYREEIASDYTYYYGEEDSRPDDDYWGEKAIFKAVPYSTKMHKGALAPNPIWGEIPSEVPKDALEEYLRRLICVISGRFVCLIGGNNGIPRAAVRYRWRYWDNNGRVYQDVGIKWTSSFYPHLSDEDGSRFCYVGESLKPGDFAHSPLWMNEGGSLDREFWEAVWCWKFEGTTGNDEWDKCLWKLARQAGVILEEEGWPLKEAQLDRIATEKGWTKIRCNQPAMSSYIRGGEEKINFYLSTGTVGSCLNHPVQGKTQLFRRGMDMEKAAILFGNPREHTGRGYKRKASEPSRLCAACGRDKPCEAFSKNQRKKGLNPKCVTCVQGNR